MACFDRQSCARALDVSPNALDWVLVTKAMQSKARLSRLLLDEEAYPTVGRPRRRARPSKEVAYALHDADEETRVRGITPSSNCNTNSGLLLVALPSNVPGSCETVLGFQIWPSLVSPLYLIQKN